MNKITLYFAASLHEEASSMIKNRLFSYAYPEELKKWIDRIDEKKGEGKVIIDSGAFSAWNAGREIDIDDYIDFATTYSHILESKGKKVRVVNLDVIPGEKGSTSSICRYNSKVIKEAATKGFKNLLYFLQKGIIPIHVFHQGEDFKWLERMCEKTDYIGVSPANDVAIKQKKLWIKKVFDFLYINKIKVDTHGFGIFGFDLIKDFPFTSCDATTSRLQAGYGNIMYPKRGFTSPLFGSPVCVNVKEKRLFNLSYKKELENMLCRDGYSLEELSTSSKKRTELNVRTCLWIEKVLNDYKSTKEYKPRVGLFV